MTRPFLALACLFALFAHLPAFAGQLEDSLLAGASARLDLKGVELAIRRGAKVSGPLPHPDAPNVRRTPIQFVLSALIGADDPDAPKRAEQSLRALFKAGATLTGDFGELFSAVSGGHERIVTLLLEQGANPHTRIYGYTPAELSVKYDQQKLLPIFYARGVARVEPVAAAQIQLVQAASRQRLSAMREALAAGAQVNALDPSGSLAIVQLFSMPLLEPDGYDAVRWILSETNVDPSTSETSEDRSTALHKLIERNSYRQSDLSMTALIAEALLRKGAEVSAVDSLGRTPLHYAAQYGNVLVMRVLIQSGAKIMVRDALRKSPLDLAKSGDAIKVLREAGARE